MNKQPHRKHIPQRTCVVCRETAAKRTLTRIVRTADDGVQVDLTGKRSGRGAYLCSQVSCWKTAVEFGRSRKSAPHDFNRYRQTALK